MKVDFVQCSDWEGLYINGTLRIERHNLCAQDVIEAFVEALYGVDYSGHEIEDEYMESLGYLPTNFSDIEKEKIL